MGANDKVEATFHGGRSGMRRMIVNGEFITAPVSPAVRVAYEAFIRAHIDELHAVIERAGGNVRDLNVEFDQWLDEHDAEVRESVIERVRAWRNAPSGRTWDALDAILLNPDSGREA